MTSTITARLLGPLSIDQYRGTVDDADTSDHADLPGGGALNMAFHWARRGLEVEVISRVSSDRSELFDAFCDRHGINSTPDLIADGPACTVDIRFADDRQPVMDQFVEGVLADVRVTVDEADRLFGASPSHLVLVEVVDRELHRLAAERLVGAAPLTGDFLSARHLTVERFAATLRHLDIGFVGWPGRPDDAGATELANRAVEASSLLVMTFGSQGVRVIDGRTERRRDHWFEVDPVEVIGTTVGCGDAFIAAFLAEWYRSERIDAAVDAGRALGAEATSWLRPLPDHAYHWPARGVTVCV
ncbi:MAG: PfkB family carbohydrate kinase [Ilumatobacter sp.]|jgi:sugar/nucleoside kinase (ribokinase family)|uniref:PfkB family carbohydrate kinase n=1 Tax=Ilumatobacter sp. TaxID=1967498 RepID=UPI00391D36E6